MEIIEFKPIGKGALIGECSIRLPKWGNFVIRRVKIFEKDAKRWITFPSAEYEKEGKKCYFYYNTFETREMMDAFRDQFFEAFDKLDCK